MREKRTTTTRIVPSAGVPVEVQNVTAPPPRARKRRCASLPSHTTFQRCVHRVYSSFPRASAHLHLPYQAEPPAPLSPRERVGTPAKAAAASRTKAAAAIAAAAVATAASASTSASKKSPPRQRSSSASASASGGGGSVTRSPAGLARVTRSAEQWAGLAVVGDTFLKDFGDLGIYKGTVRHDATWGLDGRGGVWFKNFNPFSCGCSLCITCLLL